MPVQVEEDSDSRARLDATLAALVMHVGVHEPRPLLIYVHAPAFVVFACDMHNTVNKKWLVL